VLSRLIELVFSGSEPDAMLAAIPDLILEAVCADACFVHLIEPDGERLTLRGASDPYRAMVGRLTLELGQGVAGWVAQHRSPVTIVDDKWSDPRYHYVPELGGDRYTSMVSVPLISPSDRLIGAVNIHTEARREFSDKDIAFLEHVASLVAAALEHATLLGELAAKEAALQGMIERSVQAQEEERRRVATEIHDGVTQHLISIWYRMNACESLIGSDPDGARAELAAAKELIDAALDEARNAIYDLRPAMLDDLGLAPALQALAARVLGEGQEPRVEVGELGSLPAHLETALYRIAQEAFNNIRKHAGPCNVELVLERTADHALRMVVRDDGTGFDADAYLKTRPETSFGLAGMAERAGLLGGRLRFDSKPGRGTTLELTIPGDDLG
jgi:signal transduction histidine kinase